MKYRVKNSPHTRTEKGRRVRYQPGDVFEPTAQEIEQFGFKLEPVGGGESAIQGDAEKEAEHPAPGGVAKTDYKEEELQDQIWHLGGGWYELPNGERLRGKDNAMARMKELWQVS